MPVTPQITITANLQQVTGSIDAASAVFELVNFGSTVPRISGTCLILQISTKAVADGSGNISVTLWGNDVITPAGTYYTVTYYNESGGQVAKVPYQFVGSGSFDLSTLIPIGEQVVANQTPNSAIPGIFNPVSHQFLTGMNSVGQFSAAQPAFSDLSATIAASQLITPTSSTLGGVKSLAAVSHNFLTSIGTDGVPVAAQPAFTDISGTVAATQLPNPSASSLGGIQSFAAQASKWINAISTSGVPSATQPAFSDLSGTASTAQVPNLDASKITTGLLALARGGTNADLSATGGTSQVLKQVSVGAAITVGQLAASDLSNGTSGSGAVALVTSPSFTTPTLGVATATSINKVAITAPASSAMLTIANGKTLTANNSLTLAGSDSTTITFQGTDTYVGRATTDTLTNKTIGAGGLAGLTPKFQVFTASGTFTIPAANVKVTIIGAGGAGGGGSTTNSGAGGGGGGVALKWLTGLTVGSTLTVTVGTGGTAGTAGANSGNAGGASSISSGTQTITTVTANGGGGGNANGQSSGGGTGGTCTNADQPFTGNVGIRSGMQSGTGGGSGAPGPFGGAGAEGFGSAGSAATAAGAGGGGAGGTVSNFSGGAGANGLVIFEWVV
jgi:hypothetical protein